MRYSVIVGKSITELPVHTLDVATITFKVSAVKRLSDGALDAGHDTLWLLRSKLGCKLCWPDLSSSVSPVSVEQHLAVMLLPDNGNTLLDSISLRGFIVKNMKLPHVIDWLFLVQFNPDGEIRMQLRDANAPDEDLAPARKRNGRSSSAWFGMRKLFGI